MGHSPGEGLLEAPLCLGEASCRVEELSWVAAAIGGGSARHCLQASHALAVHDGRQRLHLAGSLRDGQGLLLEGEGLEWKRHRTGCVWGWSSGGHHWERKCHASFSLELKGSGGLVLVGQLARHKGSRVP